MLVDYCIYESNIFIEAWNNINTREDILKVINNIYTNDYGTYIHSVHVAILATLLGKDYGVPNVNDLFLSALLHDYGKVLIPSKILHKPEALNACERKVMETHSFLGYSALKKGTSCNKEILAGILDHHERIDGKGYSKGKTGEVISLFGKIIAIADDYSALTTKRRYREYEYTHEDAVEYIKNNVNIKFDMDITMPFLQRIEQYNRIANIDNVCNENSKNY